jgi:anti-sigma B factor antagonist
VGRALVAELVGRGYEVVALSRHPVALAGASARAVDVGDEATLGDALGGCEAAVCRGDRRRHARSHTRLRTDGSKVVVAVAGEVDMATALKLAECLLDQLGKDVTLDFAGVTFLDARGMAALAEGYKELRASGGSLRITGERDNVRKILKVVGLDRVLHGVADH